MFSAQTLLSFTSGEIHESSQGRISSQGQKAWKYLFFFQMTSLGSCSAAAQHLPAQLRNVTWRNIGSTRDSALPYTAVGREKEQITDLQIPPESENHLNWERAQRSVGPAMNLCMPSAAGSNSATSAGHSMWHQTRG